MSLISNLGGQIGRLADKLTGAPKRVVQTDKKILDSLVQVEKLIARAEKLGVNSFLTSAMRTVEGRMNTEGWMERIMMARFQSSSEYGPGSKPWAPRKSPLARNKILWKTGKLRSGSIQAVRGTFSFEALGNVAYSQSNALMGKMWKIDRVPVKYARPVQFGTKKMISRPFIKDPTKQELGAATARGLELLSKQFDQFRH